MLSVKKELKIFRGSYEEVMSQPTEDMTIYLSWDTQEIFVGNKFGVKTPYTGGDRLTERQVRDLVSSLLDSKVNTLQTQMVFISNTSNEAKASADAVTARLDDLEEQLSDDITERVNELITSESLADEFYNKEKVDSALIEYYENIMLPQFRGLLPQTEGEFSTDYDSLKSLVSSINTKNNEYASVRVLSPTVINEGQLISLIGSSLVEPGLYSFSTSSGSEILNKIDGSTAVRLSPDGFTRRLVDGSWGVVTDPEGLQIVYSVSDVLPDSEGNVELDADDISNSTSRKWNSLLPSPSDQSVNPDGRNTGYSVGSGSVSFGQNSAAQGVSSIAIGRSAIATGDNSVQIGEGSNIQAGTLRFMGNEIINSSGKIPTERIIETFSAAVVSIPISSWNTSTRETGESVAVSGLTPSSLVWVSPAESSLDDYSLYGVRAVSQGNGFITFKCDQVPDAQLSVNLIWRI